MKATKELIPYPTSNTYQAAYIRAIGGKMIGIDRTDPKEYVYNFSLTPRQEELAQAYFSGAKVVAIAYADSHKNLMRMIHNGDN